VATLALGGVAALLSVANRPPVLDVTRDPSAETVISIAEQVTPPPADSPTSFVALWGNDYWGLAYAQAFQGRLPGLDIVDHNADLEAILARGSRLLTFSKTFYLRSLSWWDQRLEGRVFLSSAAPDIVEIALEPLLAPADVSPGPELDLENGLRIHSATLSPGRDGGLKLTVYWQAKIPTSVDYSVAVHLVAHDPPRRPEDVLSQADQRHPVHGWYPTSRWVEGEVVRDHYLIEAPVGAQPQAVRIAMYRTNEAGGFVNSPWLSLPMTQ
jgi:hypothetical protein